MRILLRTGGSDRAFPCCWPGRFSRTRKPPPSCREANHIPRRHNHGGHDHSEARGADQRRWSACDRRGKPDRQDGAPNPAPWPANSKSCDPRSLCRLSGEDCTGYFSFRDGHDNRRRLALESGSAGETDQRPESRTQASSFAASFSLTEACEQTDDQRAADRDSLRGPGFRAGCDDAHKGHRDNQECQAEPA